MKIKFLESFINTIFTPNTSQEYIQQTQKILTWAGLFLILSASITTTMNFRKGYILMGISTSFIIVVIAICLILNYFKIDIRKITLILSFVFASQFTLYALTGSNEGFAILWVMLVPALEMGFLDMFWGFLVSAYFQVLLIIMFWTPLRDHFSSFYTQAFIGRFPVIYFANFSCTLLFFVERHKLQLKKNEYEDREKKKLEDLE